MQNRATFVLLLLVSATGASGQEVVITGGTEDGHNYRWIVSNKGSRAIDHVEFPYYRADTVTPPEGWSFEATGGLVGQGGGGVGRFIVRANSQAHAIGLGNSLNFALRVAPAGAFRGRAAVTVGFSDGTRVQIDGVECPLKESWLRRHFPVLGLGASFALFLVLAQALRKRRSAPEAAQARSMVRGYERSRPADSEE